MIARLVLKNFKGFEQFDVRFRRDTWLVGPNSAGKSTIVAALRTAARMVAHAKRRRPEHFPTDGVVQVPAHTLPSGRFGLEEENLRHEFREVETRLEVTFTAGATLVAVWPVAEGEDAYFYAKSNDDVYIRTPPAARENLPDVGIVPTLSPVEHEEKVLTEAYVRTSFSERLASRHTRNQLRLLKDEPAVSDGYDDSLAEFLDWAEPWTPDFQVRDLVERITAEGYVLDVYCREAGSRGERELFWAGDGVQVWIQLLVHLYRNQGRDAVILDEPELYLHADLQRRLVRLLETMDTQTIAASHSAEVLVEAPIDSVVWVSKDRRAAVRAPSEKIASELTSAIGSQFNLRLARVLKARAVVFVEGEDMRLLRNAAQKRGAARFASESELVTVPLRGFSSWENVEPFSWLLEELLDNAVDAYVLLDRGYRTDRQISQVEKAMRDLSIKAHVWRRKELESYFLVPATIARSSGADVALVRDELVKLATASREQVFARMLAERLTSEVTDERGASDVTADASKEFEERWTNPFDRPNLCDARGLLAGANRWLEAGGHATVSARTLSAALRRDEVPQEMAHVIEQIEQLGA